jgi:AcrR family transcriptional regulator
VSKGESTRDAILDQAMAVASTEGLGGLSIGDLAKRVGMSKSGLFAHFDSKEALQLEVLDLAIARFVDHVMAPALRAPRGEPRLRAIFDRWLLWERAGFQPGGCLFMATADELDDRPGPLRDRLVASQRDWLQALATAVRIGVEEGHLRRDLDVEQLAHDVYGVMLAYHHFSRLMRDPDAERRARRSFDQLIAASKA